ncbi:MULTISPECIES: flavin reductase family protein [unclassified Rhodococcus (in: high G+C Gram-positive bacteria)]|uniref:flavin reductase family protein n=1 Tax=unclassified Rhodococcus (in: high G+C Gram-positive bacteria) TaxID=192944 RepID=UPI00096AA315|nr:MULTISPECIES: flavin reductase family protein [unclassified Rhodococcus (in: high G+C Gram-positive bacteria)]
MSEVTAASADPQLFRQVLGHYPTGVVVVTGLDSGGDVLAMVVGTFSSVSMEPALVSFMPMKTSRTFEKMLECSSLCINIVGGDQEDVVLTIARRWEKKLDGIDWHPSPLGNPVLQDSVAWIDTRIWKTVEAGDHWIVLCSVQDMAVTNAVSPLIFFQGGYGSFVCTSLMARMDHEILPAIHSAHAARLEVEELASSIGCEVTVFTTTGPDEVAAVLSATGPGIERGADFGKRAPMVPPVGDTYFFDQPPESQDDWIGRLRDVDEDVKNVHRSRLAFLRENGYLFSLLPAEVGRAAYDPVRDATNEYSAGRLTPSRERGIRQSMANTIVDYRVCELEDHRSYDLGSLLLPVRDRSGVYSLTLRLAQLPLGATRARIENWLADARDVVDVLEGKSTRAS